MIDNDITTGFEALDGLTSLCTALEQGHEPVAVEFDDESLDMAQITVAKNLDGWSRLTITDWFKPEILPRADVLIETSILITEIRQSVADFTAMDTVMRNYLINANF